MLKAPGVSSSERGLGARVSIRVSHRDAMHGGAGRRYFEIGLSGLRSVEAALAEAGAPAPREILDLPCGHGRVLRWLAARFPQALLTACDLDRHGVDYCAGVFGARPVYSEIDFGQLRFPGRFDLVWCGSLVTHLDGARIEQLLACLQRHLEPSGVAVVTTHGKHVVDRLRAREVDYLLDGAGVRAVLAGHDAAGAGYAGYPGAEHYGISVTSETWMREAALAAGLRVISCTARGWDDHQDVWSLAQSG